MKRICTVSLFLLGVALVGDAGAASIYSLIMHGELKAARDSLSTASTASLRDGNHLFYQSLLEPDADKPARLMEAALNAAVSPVYQEEIYLRLAHYYYLKEDWNRLGRIVSDYRVLWENGQYRRHMQRYSTLVDQMTSAYESAIRQADRYLLEYTDNDAAQWGIIDKARIMLAYRKRIGAVKLLRKLVREKSGPGIPQALYLLAMDAVDARRMDDAVFYYNILREGYPAAVGLDAVIKKMASMPTSDTEDNTAEKLTGTFYSVQVGVFSRKGNAKRQAKIFAAYDKKVDIETKVISGKKYRVVYVGRFATFDEANRFKKVLEANHHEVFRVVAR